MEFPFLHNRGSISSLVTLQDHEMQLQCKVADFGEGVRVEEPPFAFVRYLRDSIYQHRTCKF